MARSPRFAVVRATFNGGVTAALAAGAHRAFAAHKVPPKRIDWFDVPGAFELPLAAQWLAKSKRYQAIVALGCVVRGETPHFEYVAGECARGLARVALDTGVPVIFGVLTTETLQQALDRASEVDAPSPQHGPDVDGHGNKGYEAALAALDMVALKSRL